MSLTSAIKSSLNFICFFIACTCFKVERSTCSGPQSWRSSRGPQMTPFSWPFFKFGSPTARSGSSWWLWPVSRYYFASWPSGPVSNQWKRRTLSASSPWSGSLFSTLALCALEPAWTPTASSASRSSRGPSC